MYTSAAFCTAEYVHILVAVKHLFIRTSFFVVCVILFVFIAAVYLGLQRLCTVEESLY